eukprot:gene2832-4239_t
MKSKYKSKDIITCSTIANLKNGPPPRRYHSSVYFDHKIYIWGGDDMNWDLVESNMYCYDLKTGLWNKKDTPNEVAKRSTHSTSLYDGKMIIIGGVLSVIQDEYQFIIQYEILKNEWKILQTTPTTNGPPDIGCHSAVVYKDSIICFGGDISGNFSNKTFVYSILNNNWESINTKNDPIELTNHSASLYLDSMFVFGGYTLNQENSNNLYELNLLNYTWREIQTFGDVPPKLNDHVSIVIGSKMMIVGGTIGDEITSIPTEDIGDIYEFNFLSFQWSYLICSKELKKISGHRLNKISNNDVILTGGGIESINPTTYDELILLQFPSIFFTTISQNLKEGNFCNVEFKYQN